LTKPDPLAPTYLPFAADLRVTMPAPQSNTSNWTAVPDEASLSLRGSPSASDPAVM
jgi:hypothetical protein